MLEFGALILLLGIIAAGSLVLWKLVSFLE
jgi:hypothetical protein